MKRLFRSGAVLISALIASQAVALEVDSPAPAFTAPSTHGELSLRQLTAKGPVVLAFYFADFTSG